MRLSVRLHALGVKNPLGRDELLAVAPVAIAEVLGRFRREGLLSEGAEWTLRGGAARCLADELRPSIEREIEADEYLIGRLLAGRSRPS